MTNNAPFNESVILAIIVRFSIVNVWFTRIVFNRENCIELELLAAIEVFSEKNLGLVNF